MKKKWLFIVLILSGCATSRITSTWKGTDVSPKRYDPVLVLGLIREETDSSLCRIMERRFADDLKKLGYNAISSIAEYGLHAYDDIKEEETFKLLYTRGIGAIITIELLGKVKEKYEPPAGTNNDFSRNGYTPMQQRLYTPGTYLIETNYFWETNLYDMNGFRIVYSVQTQSYEPGPAKSLAQEYGQMIINSMVKKGVLKEQVRVLKAF